MRSEDTELAAGGPCQNTDREIWREREGDYYADSIHVTEGGGIGIDCGGHVFVMPVREWHRLAKEASTPRSETTQRSVVKVAEDAIDLFNEYRAREEYTEEQAKAAAINEFADAEHFNKEKP